MKRTISRIIAMMVLYNYEATGALNKDDVIAMMDNSEPYDEVFCDELINGVIKNKEKIDFMISKTLKNYSIGRLNLVDASLIRIGTYELLNTKTPQSIVINEIVEISKEYSEISGYASSKFNNSVLDNIYRSINDGK